MQNANKNTKVELQNLHTLHYFIKAFMYACD